MFKCQECGKLFRTAAAAQRASNDGCPKCGGVDVDIASHEEESAASRATAQRDASEWWHEAKMLGDR